MDREKILVIDDEIRMLKLISDFLKKEGYEVITADNGNDAIDIFLDSKNLSLIICDVMMPGLDGYQVVREIRTYSDIPVIFLTAKDREYDEINGFKAGADDYISKPFSPRVLVLRVKSLLRRNNPYTSDDFITCNGIELNKSAHEVRVDGKLIELSYKEFELLEYFLLNRGIALPRNQILNNVWNYNYLGDDRTIDTHVKKIRQKLGEKGNYIKTIWGLGYKFDA